uniref:Uncharacterized protein n=1 Tax=Opuntia streptacantha TaxID=393608 RepID=A0A7C8ZMS2_OPUST
MLTADIFLAKNGGALTEGSLMFAGILASIWQIFCTRSNCKFSIYAQLKNDFSLDFGLGWENKLINNGTTEGRRSNISLSYFTLSMYNVQERDDYALELAMGDE